MSIFPSTAGSWERALYRSFLMVNVAVLGVQGWGWTQTPYLWQEMLEPVSAIGALIGLGLVVASVMGIWERRRGGGERGFKATLWIGVVVGVANVGSAVWWVVTVQAIIN